MIKSSLLNSSAIRLTLSLCGVFFLSVILMFGIALYETEEDLGKGLRGSVLEMQATLLDVYRRQGFTGLKEQVNILSVGAKGGRTLLYLTDSTKHPVAGNVSRMETFVGWRDVAAPDIMLIDPPRHPPDAFVSYGTEFSEGDLIIGRSKSEIKEMRFGILESLLGGFIVSLALTFATAIVLARRNNRRLFLIEKTLARTAAGNFSDRIAGAPGRHDDLARVQASINAMLDRLETTVESLRQVSVDIAHELKTPVQRLRQKLEILAQNKSLDGSAQESVDLIIDETNGIIDIFQAMLRISQIEGGGRKSQFTKVDLLQICQKIFDIFMPVAEDQNQRLELQFDKDCDYSLVGDADLLTQMITNLVENAIRHCDEGIVINITLSERDGHRFLEVSDNGPGIPANERPRVMERLYRLEKSRTTPGSGLGLSLVKAIADLHEFKIFLESNEPGLRVVVQIP